MLDCENWFHDIKKAFHKRDFINITFLSFLLVFFLEGCTQLLTKDVNTPKNLINCFIYRQLKNTQRPVEEILYTFLWNHEKNHKNTHTHTHTYTNKKLCEILNKKLRKISKNRLKIKKLYGKSKTIKKSKRSRIYIFASHLSLEKDNRSVKRCV